MTAWLARQKVRETGFEFTELSSFFKSRVSSLLLARSPPEMPPASVLMFRVAE
jgi:hypothetical protein